MKFPNKMIQAAYQAALGKTFTWSPTRQVFTDEVGNSDYHYPAMVWLKDQDILHHLPWSGELVHKFAIKDQHVQS